MNAFSHLLSRRAQRQPDAIAIMAPGREPLTYSRLFSHVDNVTQTLNAMGFGRHDRLAIVLPNGPEMASAFLAIAACATSAPLNPAYRAQEYKFYLKDLNAKALIIDAALDSPARGVARGLGIPVIELASTGEAAGLFTLAGNARGSTKQNGFAQPDDVALMLHTSGTTSRPKMVPLTHRNICTSAANIRRTLQLTKQDRCLNVMPLFHIHGLMAATLASLTGGGSLVCTSGFDSVRFFDWLETYQPTWYTAVPTMHQAILAATHDHPEMIARHSLRFIRSSSSSLPPTVMSGLEEIFQAPVIESYGMTEASHQMTSNPLPPHQRKPGSVGIPAGPKVSIMDEKSAGLLETGEAGEIVIQGENVTHGYVNNAAANRKAFTDGWFRTGDQGYIDDDGYLFITGRLKEMILRGGENIAPREVDEILLGHPAVAQAVTFSVPHSSLGEDVSAAVVLRENSVATESELRQFAFDRLADYKVPSQILTVNQIPKGPTGKLQRIGLHEKLANEMQHKFAAPRTEIEKILLILWREVLRVDRIGIHDNFFAAGGDSLAAGRLMVRLNARFQLELPLKTVFHAPSIAGQALLVTSALLDEIENE